MKIKFIHTFFLGNHWLLECGNHIVFSRLLPLHFFRRLHQSAILSFALLGLLSIAGLLWPLASLGQPQQAVATSIIEVEPQIAVHALTPLVFMRQSGRGEVSSTMEFDVEANSSEVEMYVESTDLFFNKNHNSRKVPTIPLQSGAAVEISAVGALIERKETFFEGTGEPIEGLPTLKTGTVHFESGGEYNFSHRIFITVTWNQDEDIKPAGTYSGKTKLTCFIVPPD